MNRRKCTCSCTLLGLQPNICDSFDSPCQRLVAAMDYSLFAYICEYKLGGREINACFFCPKQNDGCF